MPDQQQLFMEKHPKIFSPSKGKWGINGSTLVNLKAAKPKAVRQAMIVGWRNIASAELAEKL